VQSSLSCTWCGKDILEPTRHQKYSFKSKRRVYCSKACGMAYIGSVSVEIMARTNRKYASSRMKMNNPMSRPASLAKMKATLKKINHKPLIRGGNGTGLTPAEQILSVATGLMPHVVTTYMKRDSGYPTNYKLDLADVARMLAIEIDGSSHGLLSRQEQDQKKENFLKSLGWVVLRFSNKQVLEDTQDCVNRVKAGI
jgi:hypothetical protein